MKARLPKGYSNGGNTNIQQLARQAQKMQEEMDAASKELDEKEYSATAGGGAVKAVVLGSLEIKSLEISKDVVDPEDVDMLFAYLQKTLDDINVTEYATLRELQRGKSVEKTVTEIISGIAERGARWNNNLEQQYQDKLKSYSKEPKEQLTIDDI